MTEDVAEDPVEVAGGLDALIAARRSRIEQLRALGREPFPSRSERSHGTADAAAAFGVLEAAGASDGPAGVMLAGRLVGAIRRFGGSAFVHLQDGQGQLQLHLRRNLLGEAAYAQFLDLFDIGDFVNARGTVFRTKTGEVSLAVDAIHMLAKSLRPLPEKWHGLQDVETRFRQRYLDLITSDEARARFVKRSRILSAMRRFLDERGFIEVETPVLQPIYGGGSARPFTTHYHALAQDMYLRIADELYLKRLLVGGLERVYEICKDFRNEGIDRTHLPEFTMMECYWAYADYRQMLELTESMISGICRDVNGSLEVSLDDRTLDFSAPWRRLTVREAISEATGIDIEDHWEDLDGLRGAIRGRGLNVAPQPTWARTVDELIGDHVEPGVWNPTFLLDYPVALSPLAKRKADDPRYVERFEPLIAGFELGNCFTELNDPIDQRARFEEAARQKASGDDEAQPLDEDFLRAMEHGMPPAGGLGIGIDRLVMVLTGTTNIRDVVLFPQLRQR